MVTYPAPQHRPVEEKPERMPRTIQYFVVLSVSIVTLFACAVLGYAAVINSSTTAENTVGLIATTGLGALISMISIGKTIQSTD